MNEKDGTDSRRCQLVGRREKLWFSAEWLRVLAKGKDQVLEKQRRFLLGFNEALAWMVT